ncbi:MAG: homoserine kinase [Actinomycetota bacterium]|nr:homoserine kinase [Actinomycetota bacterium]
MRVTVRVPATSANLGPGFDCFGLALDLCNEVTVETEAEPGVSWDGEGADELATDGTDMVSRAITRALEERILLHPNADLPPFSIHGINRIPLERGLGSSSAAAVAGVALGRTLLGEAGVGDDPHATFAHAAELEGHPDNAAAATFGGLTVFAPGVGSVHRFEPHPDLDPVVVVPDRQRLGTAEARAALSRTVGRRDAVFNIGHAALAVMALTREPDLLQVALHDRLHEDARASLMPESAALLADLRGRRIPSCLSGAGPSLLAFELEGHTVGDPPDGWHTIRPGVRAQGVEIVVED